MKPTRLPLDHTFDHYYTCLTSKILNTANYVELASQLLYFHHALPVYIILLLPAISRANKDCSIILMFKGSSLLFLESTETLSWFRGIVAAVHETCCYSARQDLIINHVNSPKPTTTLHYEHELR